MGKRKQEQETLVQKMSVIKPHDMRVHTCHNKTHYFIQLVYTNEKLKGKDLWKSLQRKTPYVSQLETDRQGLRLKERRPCTAAACMCGGFWSLGSARDFTVTLFKFALTLRGTKEP